MSLDYKVLRRIFSVNFVTSYVYYWVLSMLKILKFEFSYIICQCLQVVTTIIRELKSLTFWGGYPFFFFFLILNFFLTTCEQLFLKYWTNCSMGCKTHTKKKKQKQKTKNKNYFNKKILSLSLSLSSITVLSLFLSLSPLSLTLHFFSLSHLFLFFVFAYCSCCVWVAMGWCLGGCGLVFQWLLGSNWWWVSVVVIWVLAGFQF